MTDEYRERKHPGQENFVMILSEETGEDRSPKEMAGLVEAIREAANKYGFDISTWGTGTTMKKVGVLRDD